MEQVGDAYVFVSCSDAKHLLCKFVRNGMLKLDRVYDAYRTKFPLDGVHYCISVKARGSSQELDTLKERIRNFQDDQNNVSVENILMYRWDNRSDCQGEGLDHQR